MNPSTVGEVANIICVSPASSDCAAGPPPLYCTEFSFTPATDSNSTAARCGAEPKPADALNSLPGFCLRYSTSSFTLVKGWLLCSTSTVAPVATRQIATKSFSW